MKFEINDDEAEFLMIALINNYAEDERDFKDMYNTGPSSLLIGKLISANYDLSKVYRDERSSKHKDNQRIDKYLFMGAGYYSLIAKNKLHQRINEAASTLSGMQQNGGMGTEFNEEFDKQGKQTLKEVVLDVLTAFGLTIEDLK